MSAKGSTLSLLSKAVAIALNQGYQVTPDALKLLQGLAEKRVMADKRGHRETQGEISLESIVFTTLEDKAKGKGGFSKTIAPADLVRTFPDLFESQFLVEDKKETTEPSIVYSETVKKEQDPGQSSPFPSEMEIVKGSFKADSAYRD